MTEAQLQQAVLDLARFVGWFAYHTHDSRRSARGFPDLVLARETILYRELKSDAGQMTPEQRAWAVRLERAGGDFRVWRPSDWLDGSIERELGAVGGGRPKLQVVR